MRQFPMRTIRISDNSEIHLECLPPLFFDHLLFQIITLIKFSYLRSILQHFLM